MKEKPRNDEPTTREEGHVSFFPQYTKKLSDRELVYYEEKTNTLVTSTGVCYLLPAELSEFLDLLAEHNLQVFVRSLLSFPLLEQVVEYLDLFPKAGSVYVAPPGGMRTFHPVSLRLRHKRKVFKVVESESWGMPCSREMLCILSATFKHAGVGTAATPGAFGQALMRTSWEKAFGAEWEKHRHPRPNMSACRDILSQGTGGRVDTPGLGQQIDKLLERDLKNAYARCFVRLPTGTATRLWYGDDPEITRSRNACATYFCRCRVTVHSKLPLGPFPVRSADANGLLVPSYPREAGVYADVWLWREEIEDCTEAGCDVEIFEGWGWLRFTNDTETWVRLCEQLRDTAPSEDIALCIKKAMVAAIGYFGMGESHYELIGENQGIVGQDWRMNDQDTGLAVDGWIRKVRNEKYTGMPHWYGYCMMLCRHIVYLDMLPKAKEEHLIASNYDANYTAITEDIEEGIEAATYVMSDGFELNMLWKSHILHAERDKWGEIIPPIEKPRYLWTVEKKRTPGKEKLRE